MAVVGVSRWVLHIPGCSSLKAKRSVVRSVKDRLRSKYHVSVVEADFHDLWQKSEIWAAFAASDLRRGQSLADRLDRYLAGDPRVHAIEQETIFY